MVPIPSKESCLAALVAVARRSEVFVLANPSTKCIAMLRSALTGRTAPLPSHQTGTHYQSSAKRVDRTETERRLAGNSGTLESVSGVGDA